MIEGTHLYPMEKPALTAQLTREMIQRLLAEGAAQKTRDHKPLFA